MQSAAALILPGMVSPADALPAHWTNRLPAAARPFAQLSRLDRPIGWRLLLLPCWMGLALARTDDGFWPQDGALAVLLLIGAIAMRGAGCTYNDIVDRKIDAKVARTRARPIPSGQCSVKAAVIWTAAQCLAGLLILLALPRAAQIAALAALPLVAAYPFMKRITWWPQAWLGLCFSWGALVAGAAVQGDLSIETGLLFAGCIAWVIGYDTLYALQDIEDDALVGVRSTARLFGDRWRPITAAFYVAALSLWAAAAWTAGAGWPTFLALSLIGGAGVAPMLSGVDPARPASALAAFKANFWIGLAIVVAFALAPAWRTLRPLLDAAS